MKLQQLQEAKTLSRTTSGLSNDEFIRSFFEPVPYTDNDYIIRVEFGRPPSQLALPVGVTEDDLGLYRIKDSSLHAFWDGRTVTHLTRHTNPVGPTHAIGIPETTQQPKLMGHSKPSRLKWIGWMAFGQERGRLGPLKAPEKEIMIIHGDVVYKP